MQTAEAKTNSPAKNTWKPPKKTTTPTLNVASFWYHVHGKPNCEQVANKNAIKDHNKTKEKTQRHNNADP